MKHLDLDVYEPGDTIGTMSKDGKVAVFMVGSAGELIPSDNRLFSSDVGSADDIEVLHLSVRTFNVLKREGVHLVGQMMAVYDQKGEKGFEEMRNMGEVGVREVLGHIKRLRGEEEAK
jgi:DNA-directed RNA polymerase alpha subunit